MIDGASRVGIVLADVQRAFVVKQTVQNMRGFAGVGSNDLGMKWRITIGDMRVEFQAGL